MGTTKFKLINTAQKRATDMDQIVENVKTIAASINEDPAKLLEGATQVLAGLKQMITAGQPLTKAGMSPQNLANVVSGVRVLTTALPKITDPQKQTRALKILGGLTLGQNMSTSLVSVLGDLAQKDPQYNDLQAAFQHYAQSGQPSPDLIKLLGQLQMQADQVARSVTPQQQAAPNVAQQQPQQQQKQAGTPQPAVVSSAVGSTGQVR